MITTTRNIRDAACLAALAFFGLVSALLDLTVGFEAIARAAMQRWLGG